MMTRELFRALEIRTDAAEHWVMSDSIKWFGDSMWLRHDDSWVQCFPETRSVSYENMIDKNGKKIFASLNQKSMLGGDKFIIDNKEYIYFFSEYGLETVIDTDWIDKNIGFNYHLIEISGVKK